MQNKSIYYLKNIGFSNLEALIYLTLLNESNLTGYRIAQILGKPVRNTYTSLMSLQKKRKISMALSLLLGEGVGIHSSTIFSMAKPSMIWRWLLISTISRRTDLEVL